MSITQIPTNSLVLIKNDYSTGRAVRCGNYLVTSGGLVLANPLAILPGNVAVSVGEIYSNGMLVVLELKDICREQRLIYRGSGASVDAIELLNRVSPLAVADLQLKPGVYSAAICGEVPCKVLIVEKPGDPAFMLGSQYEIYLLDPSPSLDMLGVPICADQKTKIAFGLISSASCLLDNLNPKYLTGKQNLLSFPAHLGIETTPAKFQKVDPFIVGKEWGTQNPNDASRVLKEWRSYQLELNLGPGFAAFIKGIESTKVINIRAYLSRQNNVHTPKLRPGAVNIQASHLQNTNRFCGAQLDMKLPRVSYLKNENTINDNTIVGTIGGLSIEQTNEIHGLKECVDKPKIKLFTTDREESKHNVRGIAKVQTLIKKVS